MKIPFEKTLRQPPPRRIGIYSQMAILFSGFMQQMGWLFVGMGMIFVVIFLPFSGIIGAQDAAFPKFVAFVLIFPIAGLFMVIPGLRKQAKGLDLLRNGEFTRAAIKSKEHTGSTIKINNQPYPVMKFTFEFEYQGSKHEAICRTHLTEPLEDEEQETILFYPTKPDFNIVYDGISNSPGMDPMGNFLPVSWTKAWVFLGPAVGIFMTAIALRLFFLI